MWTRRTWRCSSPGRRFAGSRSSPGCGACEDACRYAAITVSDDLAKADGLLCEGCRACGVVCSEEAIDFAESQAGTLLWRETEAGPLVHGALGIAQDNSGKLVARVREEVRILAEERGIGVAILDGPPGIGCPVHAAVGRTDLVVAVTEPSPSGLHDLERMLDLTWHLGLEVAVVVNKCDLNPSVVGEIERLATGRGAPVAGRIPFEEEVPPALVRGETPLAVPAVAAPVIESWEAIRAVTGD